VAIREAIRLQTHKPTEPLEASSGEPAVEPEAAVGVETESAARDALAAVAALPARQRRVLGLHVGGYSYAEIGTRTGDSYRTVDRQMTRARRALQAV